MYTCILILTSWLDDTQVVLRKIDELEIEKKNPFQSDCFVIYEWKTNDFYHYYKCLSL